VFVYVCVGGWACGCECACVHAGGCVGGERGDGGVGVNVQMLTPTFRRKHVQSISLLVARHFSGADTANPYSLYSVKLKHMYLSSFPHLCIYRPLCQIPHVTHPSFFRHVTRLGHNRTYTPHMTVYFVVFLSKIPYIHYIYVWFWPILNKCLPGTLRGGDVLYTR